MSLRPARTDGAETIAIIAGNGRLPLEVAEAARRRGLAPFIVQLSGENSNDWSDFPHIEVGLGAFSSVVSALRARGVKRVVLSGGVRRRPELLSLRPTIRLVTALPEILARLKGAGDDRLIRMVIAMFERHGFTIVGAQEIAGDLVVTAGPLGKMKPDSDAFDAIEAATEAAHALGALDVGQGAVALGRRVVALEGAEGTDEMLARIVRMRQLQRISPTRPGVLVKMCKPAQDLRADLPSIGLETVRAAHAAGLSGIAVEAGRSLVLGRSEAVAEADRLGLFIYGLETD